MNETLVDEFRQKLLAMASDLDRQNARGQNSQKTVELDQQSVGRLSRMDAMQQQAMAKAAQSRRNQVSNRISAALERIKDEEYGFCVQCGEDIDIKRLKLDPAIPTCLSCAKG